MQVELSKKEARRQHWQKLIEEWQLSGEGKTQFCRSRELNVDLFMYYSRRYTTKPKESGFVAIKVVSNSSAYELTLLNGEILKFYTASSLSEVIAQVRGTR